MKSQHKREVRVTANGQEWLTSVLVEYRDEDQRGLADVPWYRVSYVAGDGARKRESFGFPRADWSKLAAQGVAADSQRMIDHVAALAVEHEAECFASMSDSIHELRVEVRGTKRALWREVRA